MTTTGCYGKLTSRGDFISRDLPASFIQPWDAFLAAGLLAAQNELGDGWLQAYLVSPLWRFALAPGVSGDAGVVGVVMPSIDRVGRYFPLTVARVLAPFEDFVALACGPQTWFETAEAALLATLDQNAPFEQFEAALQQLADQPPLPAAEGNALTLARSACSGASLWWGEGGERIAAGLHRCLGLPGPAAFAGLLLDQGVRG